MPDALTTPIQKALIGRQPIYDHRVHVVAYELLYRSGADNHANVVDGDAATAQVMLNTFLDIGLNQVVGAHRAFINLTRTFIEAQYCQVLPKDRVVLEVLEDIQPDPSILQALTDLSSKGYTIALDDFVYHESLKALVDLADIVKVDTLALPRETVESHLHILRQGSVKLLAEKVETQEDFEWCRSLGFDYFQGYFFCRPKIIAGIQIPANRVAIATLLAQLQDPRLEISGLEGIIKNDVSLSYKVLRYVNSAYCGLPRKVNSIGQAACMVGLERLRLWATIMILTTLEDKPFELLVTALVRALMCERLALALGQSTTEPFFTTGLFSVLDAFFDCQIDEIVSSLSLSPAINQALLAHEGLLGQTLHCVIAFEAGQWEKAESLNLDLSLVQEAYLSAVKESSAMLGGLNA